MRIARRISIICATALFAGQTGFGAAVAAATGRPENADLENRSGAHISIVGTVLNESTIGPHDSDTRTYLVEVEEVLLGHAPGSVLKIKVDNQRLSSRLVPGSLFWLALVADFDGGFTAVEVEPLTQSPVADPRATRGYQSRACGLDLDDDFVYGEAED